MCLLKYIIVPVMKLFVRETKGFNNIPKKGPAILVANHASYIDPVLIRYFTSWFAGRTPIGIQSREWLEKNWFRKFIFTTLLGQIPTNGSISKALNALQNREVLMLFPEAGRTRTGRIEKTTHTGLGVLASQSRAPVIPIGLQGTYDWWPPHKKMPAFKPWTISIRVGRPAIHKGTTKKDHLAFQHKIMHQIAKLARTKYPH
jgi:1-acyl-sn-glycerol-3-phosphate acyltransferase